MAGARLTVVALLATLACGSNADWPSSPTQPFVFPVFGGGTFLIALLGDSSLCGDIKNPQAGTMVSVAMAGSVVDGVWTGRALTPDGGQFELRLVSSNTPPPASAGLRAISVLGSATGTAIDSFVYTPGFVPRGTAIRFGDRVELTGALRTATFASGHVDSPVTFTRNGVSSTCPVGAVEWTINGPVPIGGS
jgi:hypothetical protein